MLTENKQFLITADEKLASIINQTPEPIVNSTNNVFHDLMSCILEQQIHYRSTKKVFEKILKSAELEMLTVENFLQFEETAYDNIKLSISKYQTTLAVFNFFSENKLHWEALSDEEVRKHLSSIKGIGNWTIDMLLLYTLKRPNVFPHDDFHLKQIMVNLYGLNPKVKLKASMIEIAESWGNQKSLAVLYLLAWKEYQKQRK